MQAQERSYTVKSQKRMVQEGNASLAATTQYSAPAKKDTEDLAAPMQNLCMNMPFLSAVQQENAPVRVEEELDGIQTIALPEDQLQLTSGASKLSIADQYEDALSNTSRDLNLLSAESKAKRLLAVKTLHAKLLEPPLQATVLALTLPHIVKPILKRFEDPAEAVRDGAVALMSGLLEFSADIDQVTPYVIPVTLERLRATRPIAAIETVKVQAGLP